MLKSLSIQNIAVIEKAEIEFSKGLNVLTGETGAGKSIIIDSINAILGERTSRELVRSGCENAFVSAYFEDVDESVNALLDELGIEKEKFGFVFTDDGKCTATLAGINDESSYTFNGTSVDIQINGEDYKLDYERGNLTLSLNYGGEYTSFTFTKVK